MTIELVHSGKKLEELSPFAEKEIFERFDQSRELLLDIYHSDEGLIRDHYMQFSNCPPTENPWSACVIPAVVECAKTETAIRDLQSFFLKYKEYLKDNKIILSDIASRWAAQYQQAKADEQGIAPDELSKEDKQEAEHLALKHINQMLAILSPESDALNLFMHFSRTSAREALQQLVAGHKLAPGNFPNHLKNNKQVFQDLLTVAPSILPEAALDALPNTGNFSRLYEYCQMATSFKNLVHHTESTLIRQDELLDKAELKLHDVLNNAPSDLFIPIKQSENKATIQRSLDTKTFNLEYSDTVLPENLDKANMEFFPPNDLHNTFRHQLRTMLKILLDDDLYGNVEQTLQEEKNTGWHLTLNRYHALAYFLSQITEDSNLQQRYPPVNEQDSPPPVPTVSGQEHQISSPAGDTVKFKQP